jgi:hypothetical protein
VLAPASSQTLADYTQQVECSSHYSDGVIYNSLYIHSRVALNFLPQNSHVTNAATYKQRLHCPTVTSVLLQKEEVDAHMGSSGSLTQCQGR